MKAKAVLWRVFAVFFALLLWQAAASLIGQRLLLASPVEVAVRLLKLVIRADFWSTVAFSFVRIVGGFFCGLLLGSLLGALASRFFIAETLMRPFVTTIKSVPVASFVVIALIWLSSGSLPVFISFLMVFPIIYSNVCQGLKSTDKKLLEMAGVFRLGFFKRLGYIFLPQLRPYLTSACAVALGTSWKAGVAAEVIGITSRSIGARLYEAKLYVDTASLFAWTLIIVLISLAFEKLFLRLLNFGYGRLSRK